MNTGLATALRHARGVRGSPAAGWAGVSVARLEQGVRAGAEAGTLGHWDTAVHWDTHLVTMEAVTLLPLIAAVSAQAGNLTWKLFILY